MNPSFNSNGGRRPNTFAQPVVQRKAKAHVMLTEENYVDLAEQAIDELLSANQKNPREVPLVTTSKIRNILAMTADLYNDVVNEMDEELSPDFKNRLNYIRVRVLYECGRDEAVKWLVEYADIVQHLKDARGGRRQYILFSRYMEAIVAFRKFKGQKDD